MSELQSKRLLTSLIFKKNGFIEIKENSQKWAKVHQLIINNGFFSSSMNLKMHFEKRHGWLKPPELRIQRLIRHFKGQSNFIICFFSSFKLFDFLSHLAAPSSLHFPLRDTRIREGHSLIYITFFPFTSFFQGLKCQRKGQ